MRKFTESQSAWISTHLSYESLSELENNLKVLVSKLIQVDKFADLLLYVYIVDFSTWHYSEFRRKF